VPPRFNRFSEDSSGNTMVEFAIAASIFATFVLGIMEFGFAALGRNAVAADAREGARFAIVRGSQSGRATDSAGVANYVKSKTSLDQTIQVSTSWSPNKDPGSIVTVKVKHAVPRRGPFIGAHTDSSISKMVVIF
jgi:Flp pilus assembly protein TadG